MRHVPARSSAPAKVFRQTARLLRQTGVLAQSQPDLFIASGEQCPLIDRSGGRKNLASLQREILPLLVRRCHEQTL
jgi:hypothetical protein